SSSRAWALWPSSFADGRPDVRGVQEGRSGGLCSGDGALEDAFQLERRHHLELVVAAGLGRLVDAPAHEGRGVAEAIALQVVVADFADALGPQRLPRQVLACAPAARGAG